MFIPFSKRPGLRHSERFKRLSLNGLDRFYFAKNFRELSGGNVLNTRKWTRELVISELRRLHSEGVAINSQYLLRSHPALQLRARKLFRGKFNNALIAAGFDPKQISRSTTRSKDELITQLHEIAESGEPLNSAHIEVRYHSLWKSSTRRFGGWYTFLTEAGYDPDEYRRDGTSDSYYGYQFEYLLRDILSVCGGYLTYGTPYKHEASCIPDFIIDDKTWIDAKLSSWSVFDGKCNTVEKYTPHCDKLIIVYLRGNDVKHPNPRVEMRSVDFYISQLIENGRSDLVDHIETLRQETNANAS